MAEKEGFEDKEIKEEQEEKVIESVEKDIEEKETITETEEENSEKNEKAGKGFFKKKEKKDKKDEKIEELNDKLLRLMAEFDNFRKRTEKEKAQMFEVGAKDIIEKILPIIDNFERGLAAATDEEKEGAFVQGIEKIYKQLPL